MYVRRCAALLILLLVAGCRSGAPAPSLREGPAAAWTLRVPTGEHTVVAFADVVVVTSVDAIAGVERRTGRPRWSRPASEKDRVVAAGDSVAQVGKDAIAVFDPATGADRWTAAGHFAVFRTAVYGTDCCTLTARDVHTGQTLWTLPASSAVTTPIESAGPPYAPAVPKYLVAGVTQTADALVDTATGRPLPGRIAPGAWYTLPAGELVVTTDNDADRSTCAVDLAGYDGRSGARRWTGKVYSGRTGEQCLHFIADDRAGRATIGADPLLAACTADGRPTVVDLTTGATVWTGDAPGTPIDGDATGVLTLDTGGIALYDLAGGRLQWKAPDPGLDYLSASFASAVTAKRVAITGAAEDHPFVLVFDRGSGRRLGRFPSWLDGAGDDWVAVTHGVAGAPHQLELEFIAL